MRFIDLFPYGFDGESVATNRLAARQADQAEMVVIPKSCLYRSSPLLLWLQVAIRLNRPQIDGTQVDTYLSNFESQVTLPKESSHHRSFHAAKVLAMIFIGIQLVE